MLFRSVKGDEEALKAALEAVPAIESVKTEAGHTPGLAKAAAVFKEGADAREEIFYTLAQAKLPVMEMIPVQKSLEDIFLELTEDVKPKEKTRKGLFGGRPSKNAQKDEESEDAAAGESAAESGTEPADAKEEQ